MKKVKYANIEYANVEIDSSGTPMATDFDDVYFSRNDGFAETIYVFIEGNNLKQRLQNYKNTEPFVVGETGFGTGSNALILALYLKEHGLEHVPVHFVSTELHPIKKQDLQNILEKVEAFKPFLTTFLENYEKLINGEATNGGTINLTPNFTLEVLVGDACETFAGLDKKVDAWFLDGFSPAKNPQMWKEDLFRNMAKDSKSGTTFATFTAARVVRDGLTAGGFNFERIKGYGFKRHMLVGTFAENQINQT